MTKRQLFARSFGHAAGDSLGRLIFWLPIIYFGRSIWIHLIDALSAHIK